MRIVVLGVGNLILSDEGIGIRAVEELERRYRLPPEVEVVDGGVSGMELLDYIAGVDQLIIVDAIRAGRGPGEVVRLDGDEIPKVFRQKLSPHHVGLSDVFATLVLTGESPGHVTAVGVEPVSLELGMALTPQVAAKLPQVVEMVVDELRAIGAEVSELKAA